MVQGNMMAFFRRPMRYQQPRCARLLRFIFTPPNDSLVSDQRRDCL